MMARSASPLSRTVSDVVLLLRRQVGILHAGSVMPMMAFIGVRISWLMLARNSLFAWVAASAASFASRHDFFGADTFGDITQEEKPASHAVTPVTQWGSTQFQCTDAIALKPHQGLGIVRIMKACSRLSVRAQSPARSRLPTPTATRPNRLNAAGLASTTRPVVSSTRRLSLILSKRALRATGARSKSPMRKTLKTARQPLTTKAREVKSSQGRGFDPDEIEKIGHPGHSCRNQQRNALGAIELGMTQDRVGEQERT